MYQALRLGLAEGAALALLRRLLCTLPRAALRGVAALLRDALALGAGGGAVARAVVDASLEREQQEAAAGGAADGADAAARVQDGVPPPPPPSLPYKVDTSRPSLRTKWTRLVHAAAPLQVVAAAALAGGGGVERALAAELAAQLAASADLSHLDAALCLAEALLGPPPPPPFSVLTGQVSSLPSY